MPRQSWETPRLCCVADSPCLTHTRILIRGGRSKFTIFQRKTWISEWKSNGVFLFVTRSNPVRFSVIICTNQILFSLCGSACQELDPSVCRRLELASSLNFDLALSFSLYTRINYSDVVAWCLDFCRMNLRPKASVCLSQYMYQVPQQGKRSSTKGGEGHTQSFAAEHKLPCGHLTFEQCVYIVSNVQSSYCY